MPDLIPISEAVRLSNALDNLGDAVQAIEGANYETERALVTVVRTIYEMDPETAAEVFEAVDRRTLKQVVRIAARFGVSVSFVESILSLREEVGA